MKKTFTDLQSLYLTGVENMLEEDARSFLEMISSDPDAPFRSTRIPILERYLEKIERNRIDEIRWERTWKAAAYEYIEITNRWIEAGAKWRCKGAYTVWEYEGERFFMWWSRTLITDNIGEAREANIRLYEIIQRKVGDTNV